MKWRKFDTQGLQVLGATVQNLVAQAKSPCVCYPIHWCWSTICALSLPSRNSGNIDFLPHLACSWVSVEGMQLVSRCYFSGWGHYSSTVNEILFRSKHFVSYRLAVRPAAVRFHIFECWSVWLDSRSDYMPHIFISSPIWILFVKTFAIFRDLVLGVIPFHPKSKNNLCSHNLSEREIRFCFSTSRKFFKFPRRRFQILQIGKSLFRKHIKDDFFCKYNAVVLQCICNQNDVVISFLMDFTDSYW